MTVPSPCWCYRRIITVSLYHCHCIIISLSLYHYQVSLGHPPPSTNSHSHTCNTHSHPHTPYYPLLVLSPYYLCIIIRFHWDIHPLLQTLSPSPPPPLITPCIITVLPLSLYHYQVSLGHPSASSQGRRLVCGSLHEG